MGGSDTDFGFLSWSSVPRRVAAPAPSSYVPRGDYLSLVIRRGVFVAGPTRRVCHLKLCDRLERTTVNYANVVDNVVKAAATRVFVKCSPWNPPPEFERVMLRAACRLGAQMGPELDEQGIAEVLKRFPTRKREIYAQALTVELDLPKHAKCTGFIKAENVEMKAADKPRVIQFRNPTFLSHMLSALKPLEHAFYHNRWCFNSFQKHTCAKGFDPLERMEILEEMVTSLIDPYVVGLDGSAFDAHVSQGALKAEWKFYGRAFKQAGYHPSTIQKLRRMGRCQLRNKVYFRCDDGLAHYVVEGNRMSGDLNTGLGNSVLQSGFIAAVMMLLGIPESDWRMLVDGDDAVLMVSGKYVDRIQGNALQEAFALFSQEVKVEGLSKVSLDNMEVIEFCQARPVRYQGGWRLVRNPMKVYNGYKQQCLYYNTIQDARRFMATIAGPEMIYCVDTPILEELFACFHRLGQGAKHLKAVSDRYWLKNAERCRTVELGEISWQTRMSFEKAFGFSVLEQLQIEQELAAWQVSDLQAASLVVMD